MLAQGSPIIHSSCEGSILFLKGFICLSKIKRSELWNYFLNAKVRLLSVGPGQSQPCADTVGPFPGCLEVSALVAALLSHLWSLLPHSPVFLSIVMPPEFFLVASRDLLFSVTAPTTLCFSLHTPPPLFPFGVLPPSSQLLLPIWWLAHSLNSSLFNFWG